ncbi:MAG: WYL domain-containing protein [Gammaproteobacteria bacterium]
MNYLRGNSLSNQFWEDEEWSDLIIEDADTLFRPYLETTIVRKVVSAIQTQQALHLYYHAKTGIQRLSIAPNHLVYASQRYHLRAYCYDWHKHIDLVLSRILEAEFSSEDWVSSEEDEDWNNYITLKFSPNPALPTEMQETLLLDFRLRNNVYSLTVRKALKAYILREMERLDWRYKIPLWVRTE